MTVRDGWAVLDTTSATAVGVRRAGDVIDTVDRRSYLHAGPQVEPGEVVGPMRGAILGALVLEGEAPDLAAAGELFDAGKIDLRPCHSASAVGAMAGIISPSTPVVVVEGDDGHNAFAPLNEGLGRALRFGANDAAVLERLRWMSTVLTPVLDDALRAGDGIDITALQSEGLRRGDECHNRNVASTAALTVRLAPAVVEHAPDSGTAAAILDFLAGNPHTFLSFSMAAAKLVADAAHRCGTRGLVTAIAGNGRRMGIRVSGLDSWITASAPVGDPKLFEGYTVDDACPMMGDSLVTEVIGLGAFALSAAPAISSYIGGSPSVLQGYVSEMRQITRGGSSRFLIPGEGFRGTPMGIDVEAVARTGISPVVNNGFAHRDAGIGQVGAGITRLPIEPFVAAHNALLDLGAGDWLTSAGSRWGE